MGEGTQQVCSSMEDDCWAATGWGERMECKSSFQIWSGCDASKCTSPDGEGGYDCIAGGKWEEYPSGEPLTCKAGYIVRKTKDFGEWQAYTCCTEEQAERSTIKGADTAVKTGRSERPAALVVLAGIGLGWYLISFFISGIAGFLSLQEYKRLVNANEGP